ncbi:methionine ABC transporter permease [Paramagnetospirillum kuznetsovii]|uniref:Methionine ABC transporter permease n=1 Tax=Paramagnetospirillum kuznetsovii TaxID=2053833 RepID=A0A364NUF5_9PROT|nr:methionine ABC transporter permease [Paramagnetospirillum kuznetsovii]RAU20545.1 methionine ABC transporter permease [Paramagnetospirillum kuznetsovii]
MSQRLIGLLLDALWETLAMVGVSCFLAALVGIPLGVVLLVTQRGHIAESPLFNRVVGALVNATRSTPFIILMVAIIPLTRLIVGTSIGTWAAAVPLTLAAIPFVARLAEASLREVDPGLIEAAQAMGATPRQIVAKVLIPEALPGIVAGMTITVVSLIGYSAMAGAVGGGGLGDLGIRYGYQRFEGEVMAAVVVVLIVLVSLVQWAGDRLARQLNKRLTAKQAAAI